MAEFLTEMHFHTAETSNCGRMAAKESVNRYIKLGYKTIILTDHLSTHTYFKYDYNSLSWDEKIDIFLKGYNASVDAANGEISILLGMELRFDDDNDPNDYLVYGISEKFLRKNKDLLDMNIKSFSKLAHKNGLLIFQAHPFRFGMKVTNPKYLDGVETFNGNPRHNSNNEVSALWAKNYNLMTTAGSDHHEDGDEGSGGIIFKNEITSNEILLKELNSQNYKLYSKNTAS